MKKTVIHPFLVALFPVIWLWSSNKDYASPNMVIRLIVFAIIMASLLLLTIHLVTREWLKASVITSLLLFAVFFYGYFHSALRDVQLLHSIIRHRYLLPLIGLLLVFSVLLVVKKKIVLSARLFFTIRDYYLWICLCLNS